MNDELQTLVDETAKKLDSWKSEADFLKRVSWPNGEPAICLESEGWTYSKVLKYFEDEGRLIFRPPHQELWYVFKCRADFCRYMTFLRKHSWMLL